MTLSHLQHTIIVAPSLCTPRRSLQALKSDIFPQFRCCVSSLLISHFGNSCALKKGAFAVKAMMAYPESDYEVAFTSAVLGTCAPWAAPWALVGTFSTNLQKPSHFQFLASCHLVCNDRSRVLLDALPALPRRFPRTASGVSRRWLMTRALCKTTLTPRMASRAGMGLSGPQILPKC
jgi:hypothetical protein